MEHSKYLTEFSNALGLPVSVASRIVSTAPLRYKVYSIPKRSGGARVIAQPAKEVKALQYLLLEKLIQWLPVHQAATAYQKGRSIAYNAHKHEKSRFILKLDFLDFFPSIFERDFSNHLKKHCSQELSDDDIKVFCRIALWAPQRMTTRRLCIGAPTSPFISNSILFDFDELISSQARAIGATYTRYADDLTFSSNIAGVLFEVQDHVTLALKKIAYPRLTVNEKKTVHASKRGRRVVTGLILTPDGSVSVGRERKRVVRAMYHRYLQGALDSSEEHTLMGFLSFINDIEPGFSDRLANSMRHKD